MVEDCPDCGAPIVPIARQLRTCTTCRAASALNHILRHRIPIDAEALTLIKHFEYYPQEQTLRGEGFAHAAIVEALNLHHGDIGKARIDLLAGVTS